MSLKTWRRRIGARLVKLSAAREGIKREQLALDALQARRTSLIAAQSLAQEVAAQVQSRAHAQIASIVSKCLTAVFDEPYEFKIVFERKRGKTEALLVFERDGLQVDPLTASGGGVVDVAAFALRLACLLLAKPTQRRLLVLDEPFRFVSADLVDRLRTLLETISSEMGVQIIMVTHDPRLHAGRVIDLSSILCSSRSFSRKRSASIR